VNEHKLICAHRGASARLPDNSMAAFIEAIAAGADVIETDVRRAGDGRLVLAHDTWDFDRSDLVELQDLVDLARGRVGLDLEILETGLERDVLDVVDGFTDWLVVTSIFPDVLAEMARLSKHVDTGLVVEAPYAGHPFDGHPLLHDAIALADLCGVGPLLIEDELATPHLLDRVGDRGHPFWVWTVNDRHRLGQLLADPAVTGVITDDPALAAEVRAELAAAGSRPEDVRSTR
jgi:glycerophosphoryl diester phosphodiesterase